MGPQQHQKNTTLSFRCYKGLCYALGFFGSAFFFTIMFWIFWCYLGLFPLAETQRRSSVHYPLASTKLNGTTTPESLEKDLRNVSTIGSSNVQTPTILRGNSRGEPSLDQRRPESRLIDPMAKGEFAERPDSRTKEKELLDNPRTIDSKPDDTRSSSRRDSSYDNTEPITVRMVSNSGSENLPDASKNSRPPSEESVSRSETRPLSKGDDYDDSRSRTRRPIDRDDDRPIRDSDKDRIPVRDYPDRDRETRDRRPLDDVAPPRRRYDDDRDSDRRYYDRDEYDRDRPRYEKDPPRRIYDDERDYETTRRRVDDVNPRRRDDIDRPLPTRRRTDDDRSIDTRRRVDDDTYVSTTRRRDYEDKPIDTRRRDDTDRYLPPVKETVVRDDRYPSREADRREDRYRSPGVEDVDYVRRDDRPIRDRIDSDLPPRRRDDERDTIRSRPLPREPELDSRIRDIPVRRTDDERVRDYDNDRRTRDRPRYSKDDDRYDPRDSDSRTRSESRYPDRDDTERRPLRPRDELDRRPLVDDDRRDSLTSKGDRRIIDKDRSIYLAEDRGLSKAIDSSRPDEVTLNGRSYLDDDTYRNRPRSDSRTYVDDDRDSKYKPPPPRRLDDDDPRYVSSSRRGDDDRDSARGGTRYRDDDIEDDRRYSSTRDRSPPPRDTRPPRRSVVEDEYSRGSEPRLPAVDKQPESRNIREKRYQQEIPCEDSSESCKSSGSQVNESRERPLTSKDVIEAAFRQEDVSPENRPSAVHYPVYNPNVHNVTNTEVIRDSERRGTTINAKKRK